MIRIVEPPVITFDRKTFREGKSPVFYLKNGEEQALSSNPGILIQASQGAYKSITVTLKLQSGLLAKKRFREYNSLEDCYRHEASKEFSTTLNFGDFIHVVDQKENIKAVIEFKKPPKNKSEYLVRGSLYIFDIS